MSRRVSLALLCEDSRHEQFVRAFLRQKGRTARRVFPDAYKRREKGGTKPNSSFVLQQIAREVKEARKAPPKRALIIVIDGDERGLASRNSEISAAIKAESMEALDKKERIAKIVPCWNIETWVHHFKGEKVNETEDYSPLYPKNRYDADPEAQIFADFVSDGNSSPVPNLPALNAAREELRRLHELMNKS